MRRGAVGQPIQDGGFGPCDSAATDADGAGKFTPIHHRIDRAAAEPGGGFDGGAAEVMIGHFRFLSAGLDHCRNTTEKTEHQLST